MSEEKKRSRIYVDFINVGEGNPVVFHGDNSAGTIGITFSDDGAASSWMNAFGLSGRLGVDAARKKLDEARGLVGLLEAAIEAAKDKIDEKQEAGEKFTEINFGADIIHYREPVAA